ncbi:PHP domain-containing protein [bacterium]|nr:PHP domain-containing protein [bacterium]
MKTNYVNLNTKSSYSFLDSLIKINDLITFSLNNNLQYAAIMDENVLYGAIEFYLACKKNNIEPIIGFELINENYHCLLIALNYDGYLNLVKICSFNQLHKTFEIEKYLKDVAVIDFYNNVKQIHEHFYSLKETDENYIACQTSKYLNKNDYADYLLLNAIKQNKTIEEDENLKTVLLSNHEICGEDYLLNETEAQKKFSEIGLKNLNNLLNNIHLEIKFHENHLLKFPIPKQYQTSKAYLQKLAITGLKQKFHTNIFDKVYIERLKEELKIINQLGFNDYFLIVHEYVNFAKQNNILIGPGRGSAVGSLVAYALNITDIDPIKYNLIFERFLNPARTSMPDIDIDIADIKRQMVIDHIFDFYNQNNMNKVSYLITFQTIKLRTAIRDCGRVLKYDLSLIDKLSKSINLIYDE